jgi:hypothetical protein
MNAEPGTVGDIEARAARHARRLGITDHISPAGSISPTRRQASTSSSMASSGRTSTRRAARTRAMVRERWNAAAQPDGRNEAVDGYVLTGEEMI